MDEKNELIRLDSLLVKLGYAQSRQRAKNLIESGGVLIDGNVVTKISAKYPLGVNLEMISKDINWVSRAGLKLEKALEVWSIDVDNLVCLDIGSSTGGFTEVLLHNGAKKVYALDVGHNQLAESLLDDIRVVSIEGQNIRETSKELFSEPIDFITVDVSFISLEHILPKINELLKKSGEAVVLIKPQFEVGKDLIQKGFVYDSDLHNEVINKIKTLSIKENLIPLEVIESSIKGLEGNKEYLIHLKKK
ncbi:TlyA family RNA methyltransferase [Patescibacteria group bacterium]|nr:TlyA family RNA methyltransferase [Patescibacteria group bacterium]